MYKNLSEMAAHEKGLWSGVVAPKIIFPCILLCLIAGNSFFQSTVFLYFLKVVATFRSLMDAVFILEEQLQPWIVYIQCIWQLFLFKTKEHLQPFFWMVPLLFLGGHLQWFSIFKGTKHLVLNTKCNKHLQLSLFLKMLSLFTIPFAVIHSTNCPFSLKKSSCSQTFFQIYCVFS